MKKGTILFICFAVLVLGCAGPKRYQLYKGPVLAKEKISILYTQPYTIARLFRINEHRASGVNGFGSFDNDSFIMELLPGDYELEVGWRELYGSTLWYSKENQTVTFVAKPGHIYLLTIETKKFKERMWAMPRVIDLTSGEGNRGEVRM